MASVSALFGILLAVLILAIDRRREPAAQVPGPGPSPIAWWTLAFGLAALVALLAAMQLSRLRTGLIWQASIVFTCAALVLGVRTLRRADRRWPVWVGFIAGLIPALFWAAFVLGNLRSGG